MLWYLLKVLKIYLLHVFCSSYYSKNATVVYNSPVHDVQLTAKDMYAIYVTILAKTHLVRTKAKFNFIAAVYRHTQYLSIPSVSSVKC